MIHVIATIDIQPGRRDEFLEIFRKLVPTVQAEAGCLEYGPTIDVASGLGAQPPARENVVVVVEKWASVGALQAHAAAPHMREYREQVSGLVAKVELRVLAPT